jgi:hypothetical protein
VRVLPNLPKRGRIFGWIPHLVDFDLHQYISVFGLNLLLS